VFHVVLHKARSFSRVDYVPPRRKTLYQTRSCCPNRAAQDRFDRERIVLGAEQAGHLGQVASNGQAVQGDDESGDRQGNTGSRLEDEDTSDVRRTRSGSAAEVHDRGARQGGHRTDDEIA
jgi:hypothetical protein